MKRHMCFKILSHAPFKRSLYFKHLKKKSHINSWWLFSPISRCNHSLLINQARGEGKESTRSSILCLPFYYSLFLAVSLPLDQTVEDAEKFASSQDR